MDSEMFCFQCEQTAKSTACTKKRGVCGKPSGVAKLQDQLTSALIGLALSTEGQKRSEKADHLMLEGLFTCITNVNFNEETLKIIIDQIHAEKQTLSSNANDYDVNQIWDADEDIRSLKSLILFGLRGMGAYAYHADVLGYRKADIDDFFFEAMAALGKDLGMDVLLPMVLKVGEVNLACMELLDQANTESFGTPEPTPVTMKVEKGPFIVITGHDLLDLKDLLEQTKDCGINVYTHGEMLPAHGYPELKKYKQLKGNFGTAWQNQQKEFKDLPAPVLFTTNCLMPPKDNYKDRIFTTAVVSFPGLVHIDEKKDFTPVIEKALELGGYDEDKIFTGINGGSKLTTGFGHGAVLSVAEKVVEAVKSGALRHIFLVGGCDGAKPGRNYFTNFVKLTPPDTLILTLACGKYRFNDLDLGSIGDLPRLMDMGQCNDAYSAIKVATTLADVFDCGVNDLPLSMVLSWYEQKAVCILLTLLHLGIKDIVLGPTLPAFISPNVFAVLQKNYNLGPLTTPEEDLKRFLAE